MIFEFIAIHRVNIVKKERQEPIKKLLIYHIHCNLPYAN